VTHEEVRGLLPRYAAGVLSDSLAEAVRDHLATGCVGCLGDVFGRPLATTGGRPAPVTVARRRRRIAAVGLVLALVGVAVAAAVIVERRPSRPRADREAVRRLADLRAARRALAHRFAELEQDAARADSAARDADAARAAMIDVQNALALSRLRIRMLKQEMRQQDLDFRQKQQSLEAVIARLSTELPAGATGRTAGSTTSGCARLPDPARGLCIAFCEVQECETADAPACEPLRARWEAVAGTRTPPCTTAVATDRLAPCQESHVDVWSFSVRRGRTYTVTVDTTDASSAADLCLAGSCHGLETFAGNDELPCHAAPAFRCPRARFVADADTTCVVAVTICSPACADASAARYELAVEGADAVSLVADDVSSLTGEVDDVTSSEP